MTTSSGLLVARDDLRVVRPATDELELGEGEVLLEVDRFSMTANNITYAVFGDAMHYWDFFPAPDGWGRVPVWGFSDVAESRHSGVSVGERIYGYYPFATHVVLQPDRVMDGSFMDGADHRRALPAAYQHYTRCGSDALYEASREDEHAIFYPLFFTSFMCEDLLFDGGLFGADQVVIASASSKTALGVAFLLHRKGTKVIALTSPGNASFCSTVGYYDGVATYDDIAALDASVRTVFVDCAGNGSVLRAVHEHLADNLVYSCIVGATHWEERSTQHDLPGAQPEFFFAPTQGAKRRRDWGADETDRRILEAWRAFLPSVDPWLEIKHSRGVQEAEAAYREVLEGRVPPHIAHMITLR